jgi:non-canonical poly(A) RNA polymerase PAPD5/7
MLGFLRFWGREFNYACVGVSVRGDGSFFQKDERGWFNPKRPGLLAIENPDEPEMDVGKNSWNNGRVQQAFDHAYVALEKSLAKNADAAATGGSYEPALPVMVRADYALAQRLGNG